MSGRGVNERREALREALEVALQLALVLALVAADQVLVLAEGVVTPAVPHMFTYISYLYYKCDSLSVWMLHNHANSTNGLCKSFWIYMFGRL